MPSSTSETHDCCTHALLIVIIATTAGLGHVVKQMPRVLRDYFLNQAILVRNETLLNSKLMSEHPNFDG